MASAEHRRLVEGLRALRPGDLQSLREWAANCEIRSPVDEPICNDRLMGGAGGASAKYRKVLGRDDDVVVVAESFRPFDERGAVRRLAYSKWTKWAANASVEHFASRQTAIPGVPGYWLHWEVLSALEDVARDSVTASLHHARGRADSASPAGVQQAPMCLPHSGEI